MLTDEGFQLPSLQVQTAIKRSQEYLEWMSSHPQVATTFASYLASKLQSCFAAGRRCKVRSKREKMWENFFKVTTSSEFVESWKMHLQSASITPSATFYQHVTDSMMKGLIKLEFPVDMAREDSTSVVDSLNYVEKIGLRYTAGYIIRALLKKMKKSKHYLREEITYMSE